VTACRNEIQVVVTVLSLNPEDVYDAVAINAASASTQLSGLPFSGPIGAVRVALIDGQWVAFPTREQSKRAVFDIAIAGRVVGDDVAIMMVEAEGTEQMADLIAEGAQAPTEQVVAQGLEAAKPFIRVLCEAQAELAAAAAKATAEFPTFPPYQPDAVRGRHGRGHRRAGRRADHRRQAGAGSPDRRGQGAVPGAGRARPTAARSTAGRRRSARRSAR